MISSMKTGNRKGQVGLETLSSFTDLLDHSLVRTRLTSDCRFLSCRNGVDSLCTYHHSSNWVRCPVCAMEYWSTGLDCRTLSAVGFCLGDPLHLQTAGRLLSAPRPCDRKAQLHLHGCRQGELVTTIVPSLWADAVQQFGGDIHWLHNHYCYCCPVS
jgi:hypothetical protein